MRLRVKIARPDRRGVIIADIEESSEVRDLRELEALLRAIAPRGVVTGARRVLAADEAQLFQEEASRIRGAVASRRHEFATGRVLLRRLIGRDDPIPVSATRAPEWPEGFVGSLSHDRTYAVAAIGRDTDVAALGIDVEPIVPISNEMAGMILREDEQTLLPLLAFCAKEATFKAWSGLGGRLLDHHDVRVTLAGQRFSAEVGNGEAFFSGSVHQVLDRHVALVVVASVHSNRL